MTMSMTSLSSASATPQNTRDGGYNCAVIYAVGTPGALGTAVPALRAYVVGAGWSLVDICFDQRNTSHPADRPGLRAALDRLRLGYAAVLVLDHLVYAEMPETSWLDAAVRTSSGSLYRVVPAAGEHVTPDGPSNAGADARLAVRLCTAMPVSQEAG